MRLLFLFSGEHPTLPESELSSVLEGEGLKWRLLGRETSKRLALIDVKSNKADFVKRLALTQSAVNIVCLEKDLKSAASKVYPKIKNAKSFCVRSPSCTIERELGALLYGMGLKVNLTEPEETVTAFKFKGKFACGFQLPLVKDFESRHPLKRPFFHPTSMRPKTGRILLNLSSVKDGDSILDPFSGVGGILIEAGVLGLKAFGWDIDRTMLYGCRKNLAHFNVKAVLEEHDALKESSLKVDAIVTDPPYGKSSSTSGIKPGELYNGFVVNVRKNLKDKGKLVVVLPEQYCLRHKGFKLEGKFKIRVHKSLTRVIWVLRKN